MTTGRTTRKYVIYVGCLLASIIVNFAVVRSFHLVSNVVPALTLNVEFSDCLFTAIATELTAELGWFFAALFLLRTKKVPNLKRRSLTDFL